MRKGFTTFQKSLMTLGVLICIFGAFILTTSAGTKMADTLNLASAAGSLGDGLVGHWTFDGADMPSGQVNDVSGQGNHGSQVSMASSTAYVAGRLGQALAFDGANDFLSLGAAESLKFSSGSFSYGGWFLTDEDVDAKEVMVWDSGSVHNYRFMIDNGGVEGFDCNVDFVTADANARYNVTVNKKVWYHALCVFDSVTNIVSLYIDGVSVAQSSAGTGGRTVAGFGNRTVQVGSDAESFWVGRADDVRIYNRALSAEEIKHLYQIGATTRVAATPAVSNNTKTGLNAGLVGHWTFDGKNMPQGQVNDISGSGNNGSHRNLATSTAFVRGPIGQGLRLDGNNDFVDVANTSGLSVTGSQVTLAAWFNNDGNPTGLHRILSMPQNEAGGAEKMTLLLDGTNSKLTFYIGTNGTPNDDQAASTTFTGKGAWRHVVGTYNAPTMKIYLDGVLQQTYTHTVPGTSIDSNDNGNFQIGRYGPTFGQYFGGMVDDARVYNRTLSDDEVKQLYQLGATTRIATTPAVSNNTKTGLNAGLQAHWTFDGKDMPNGQVYDVSGNGLHGSQRNTATSTVLARGQIGQALNFDGANDRIEFGGSTNLGTSVAAITTSAWVKNTGAGTGAGSMIFFLSEGGAAGNVRNTLTLAEDTDTVSCNGRAPDGGAASASTATYAFQRNVWYHLVCTIDYANDAGYIYVNGVAQSLTATPSFTNTATDATSPATVRIGVSGNASNAFEGLIDDVRIYHRVLSSDEAKQLYQMGQ